MSLHKLPFVQPVSFLITIKQCHDVILHILFRDSGIPLKHLCGIPEYIFQSLRVVPEFIIYPHTNDLIILSVESCILQRWDTRQLLCVLSPQKSPAYICGRQVPSIFIQDISGIRERWPSYIHSIPVIEFPHSQGCLFRNPECRGERAVILLLDFHIPGFPAVISPEIVNPFYLSFKERCLRVISKSDCITLVQIFRFKCADLLGQCINSCSDCSCK